MYGQRFLFAAAAAAMLPNYEENLASFANKKLACVVLELPHALLKLQKQMQLIGKVLVLSDRSPNGQVTGTKGCY